MPQTQTMCLPLSLPYGYVSGSVRCLSAGLQFVYADFRAVEIDFRWERKLSCVPAATTGINNRNHLYRPILLINECGSIMAANKRDRIIC